VFGEMPLDAKYLEDCVRTCHAQISEVWRPENNQGIPPLEPLDSCLLAHRYYDVWFPSTEKIPVKLLLIAESHAATDASIVNGRCTENVSHIFREEELHIGHLNLVHSLSYGESWLLGTDVMDKLPEKVRKSTSHGTRQFWRVLSALAGQLDETDVLERNFDFGCPSTQDLNEAFAHLEGSTVHDQEQRVNSKIEIIFRLRRMGILLVDMSPVPIYASGGMKTCVNKNRGNPYQTRANKLPAKLYKEVINIAWNTYAKYLITHYSPENVLIFGVGMEKAIGPHVISSHVAAQSGHYVGVIQHPSYNCIQGRFFALALRYLRSVAKAAVDGRIPAPPPPTLDPRKLLVAVMNNKSVRVLLKLKKCKFNPMTAHERQSKKRRLAPSKRANTKAKRAS
jgi:hypothetical protein